MALTENLLYTVMLKRKSKTEEDRPDVGLFEEEETATSTNN